MWTWTAIWTLLAFLLLLVHADTILAFAAEQLDQRRAHRLRLEQERTKQALVAHRRDELIWRQLNGPEPHQDAPADRARTTDYGPAVLSTTPVGTPTANMCSSKMSVSCS
jgi:hypothetical protein